MKTLINWKVFFILWIASILATIAVLPYSLELQSSAVNTAQLPLPLPVIITVQIIQNAVLVAILICAVPLATAAEPTLNVDRLVAEQSVTPDPERRRQLVQQANLLTSDKVAAMFVFHPVSPLVLRKEVNFPAASRIPDLRDFDLVTVSS